MAQSQPDPYSLKHRPVFLVPYENFDGPYAGNTDCLYLSVGWAQYDPRSVSLKTMRHTGDKWSRQAEEIPVHRVADLAILLASTLEAVSSDRTAPLTLKPNTFENQTDPLTIPNKTQSPSEARSFAREIEDDTVLNRLRKLREILERLHKAQIL